ncbi:ABC transporter permease [Sphingomonas sp. RT2P30]|uniref:ABC transporter permease n=1 Tax=Parasphingomonas halimpatiens TaxID=3096162 RepID=UPI002FCB5450
MFATRGAMTWYGLIARNLLRRPGRAAFTLLGVAFAVASYMTLTGLTRGMEESADASISERRVDMVVTDRGTTDVFAGSLPEALTEAIRKSPGVSDVASELDASLEVSGTSQAIVAGWRTDQFTWREMRLKRGRLPRPGEGAVVLGEALAQAAGVDLGGEIELNFTQFRVVGIASYDNNLLRSMAFMPISDMQALLVRPGQVTLFQVRLQRPGDAAARETTRAAIAALRPNLNVSTTAEAMRSSRLIQMIDSSSLAISIVALVIGCLSVINTLAMGVEERTRDIGILASIGWPKQRVLMLILSEGFVLAGVGGLLGVLLGWIGNDLLVHSIVPGAELRVAAKFGQALRAETIALVLGLIGAAAPAWRASRLSPATALRRQ